MIPGAVASQQAVAWSGPFQAPQGDWVGVYGATYGEGRGYYLANFDAIGTDINGLVDVTLGTNAEALDYNWAMPTTDLRGLEHPSQSHRTLGTWYTSGASPAVITLTFGAAFNGVLHVYCVDGDTTARRQTVTVNDGVNQTIDLTAAFDQGAWLHFPIAASAAEAVTISFTKTSGANAVVSGIFLTPAFDPLASIDWHTAYWADDPLWTDPGDGNAVSSWRDGSGNSRDATQATGANQPLFRSAVPLLNNRGAIDFDGSNDILQSAAFTLVNDPITLICIGKRDGAGGGTYERMIEVRSASFYTSLLMRPGGNWGVYASAEIGNTPYDTTAGHALRGYFTGGANSEITVDGVSTTGTLGTGGASQFFIGGETALTAASYGNIHVAFAALYAGDVTASPEWGRFVAWVSSYYGMTID